MCEDRALRVRKEFKAKRLYQLRYRARAVRVLESNNNQAQPEPEANPQEQAPSPSPFPPHLNIPEAKAFAAVLEQVEPGVYRYKPNTALHLSPEIKARNEKLIEIALKTVILIKRNQQLQRKLAALQFEASSFFTDVMNTGHSGTPDHVGREI